VNLVRTLPSAPPGRAAGSTAVTPPAREPFTKQGLHLEVRSLQRRPLRWFNPGWLCVLAALGLSILGLLAISTTSSDHATRAAMHLVLGLVAAAIVVIPHHRTLDWLSLPALIAVLVLLVIVLVPFMPEFIVRPRNNARRWINLGFMDLQPSELAKIAYVMALATYLKHRRSYRTLVGLVAPLTLTFVPMALILVEPDLGTALLFLPTLFAMLVAAGAKLWHLVLIAVLGMAMAPSMYPLLKPHQKNRILALGAQVTGDDRYEDDIGFQGAKAMMLVGAGGVSGVGREQARDLVLFNALPEDHNDMIFAVVCCRWGIVGAATLWTLYGGLAVGALLVAGQARDPFARLVPVGLTAVLGAQAFINCGMTIGLLPITGLTLPFVSYGGSSLISSWIMVGLVLGVALRRPRPATPEAFDFEEEDRG